MKYLVKKDYLAKAKTLPESEQERILSRMTGKLPKRLDKEKLTREEAIAIQMEIEDEQLSEWRQHMHELQAKAATKAKKETKPKKSEAKSGKKNTAKSKINASPAIASEEPASTMTVKTELSSPAPAATIKPNGKSKPSPIRKPTTSATQKKTAQTADGQSPL